MLIMHHLAQDVPFPWPKPCVFTSIVKLANFLESPNVVLRKNFISCFVSSIA